MPRQAVIIYHQAVAATPESPRGVDCPDGIAAAWAVARHFGYENIELIPYAHRNLLSDEVLVDLGFEWEKLAGKEVVIVDCTLPTLALEEIAKTADSVTILDHHDTSKEQLKAIATDMRTPIMAKWSGSDCGFTLAWRDFHPKASLPWFAEAIYARDTGANGYYDDECPELDNINAAISARRRGKVGKEAFEVFDELLEMDKEAQEALEREGAEINAPRDEMISAEIEGWSGEYIKVSHYQVPCLRIKNRQCDRAYSTLGHASTERLTTNGALWLFSPHVSRT